MDYYFKNYITIYLLRVCIFIMILTIFFVCAAVVCYFNLLLRSYETFAFMCNLNIY